MRRLLFFFLALVIPFANLQIASAQESALGNYVVDFVPINTPLGKSPLTQQLMDQWMAQVSTAFAEISNNQITFTKGVLLPEINSNSMKSSSDVASETKAIQRTLPAGFKKLITVGVITLDSTLSFSGQAYGNSHVLVNGLYETNLENVVILLHEFSHNLGLGHANAINCNSIVKNTTCTSTEYGDYSDVMGKYLLNAARTQAYLRLSAPYVEQLGLLKSDQIQIVDTSTETTVAPLYPITNSGKKIIYLPVYNRNAYSIEFRAAIGVDQDLSSNKVNILNKPNYYYVNTLSYGLQIRYLAVKESQTGELTPKIDGSKWGDNFLFVPSPTARQGFDAGSTFTLPDGSIIEFLSGDSVNGAKLKITRPADTEAPTFTVLKALLNGSDITNQNEIFAKAKAPNVINWPKVAISYKDLNDNRRVSEVLVSVDGVTTKAQSDASATSGNAEITLDSLGDHSIKLVVKDAAGNLKESSIYAVKVSKFVYPAPEVSVTVGDDPLTELFVFAQYEDDSAATLEYSLTELNFGKIINVDKGMNGVTFKIGALPRNSSFEATLKRVDPAGNPTTDAKVSGKVDESICTKSLCYVGVNWDADDFFWSVPAQVLQLQEKVSGNKWKVVASAKPYKSQDATKSAPYAYDLFYINKKPGTHTYRLYQPAFTYKGKSYSPYIGKTFVQKVIV